MIVTLIIILVIVALAATFYRPWGSRLGNYEYAPTGGIWIVVLLVLLLWWLHII